MAEEMIIQKQTLVDIANSVRKKTGILNTMSLAEIKVNIDNLSIGTDISDANIVAEDVLHDKVAYGKNGKIVGSMGLDADLITQTDSINKVETALTNLENKVVIGGTDGGQSTFLISSGYTEVLVVSDDVGKPLTPIYTNGHWNLYNVPTNNIIVIECDQNKFFKNFILMDNGELLEPYDIISSFIPSMNVRHYFKVPVGRHCVEILK